MQIYTSYFYQVRFMTPHMIPISTAKYGPSWFKQGKPWKDKNGVWNGLCAPQFAPGPMCDNLCRGPEVCDTHDPTKCLFLKTYRYQLDKLDFNDVIARCERLGNYIKSLENFSEEPVIIFLVHEAPNNSCSERQVIQEWFVANGKKVIEWDNTK